MLNYKLIRRQGKKRSKRIDLAKTHLEDKTMKVLDKLVKTVL